MKRAIIASVLGLSLVATSGIAFAKPKKNGGGDSASSGGDSNSVSGYQKVKKYDFEADDVNGKLLGPNGDTVTGDKDLKHVSLIRVRKDFIREIVKSAEDI